MTYDELVDLIKDYVENEEQSFVEHIPDFVKLAEERIYRIAKLPGIRDSATRTTTNALATITLPDDFISMDSLEVQINGLWIHLTPKEVDFLSQAYPNDTSTGVPIYYAQFDEDTIRMAPIPNGSYSLRLFYTRKPESVVTAGTSWASENAEEALLYGSLVEAYTYLKGEQDLLQLYEERFRESVGMAKIAGDERTRTNEWRRPRPITV